MTKGLADKRRNWLPVSEKEADIKASMPPFNNANALEVPEAVKQINAPAFGYSIAKAVVQLFLTDKLRAIANRKNLFLPEPKLNSFVQEKMSKVHDMIKHCRADPKIVEKHSVAIDKLEAFVTEFEALEQTSITNLTEWDEFVSRHAAPGWETKLHFDTLLSNFGFDQELSDALRKVTFKKPDGEVVTFEQHSFRWLSKALVAYGPEGALTDVVNFVFALTGESYKDLSDVDIARKIDAFRQNIIAGKYGDYWIPTHFVMDAEIDDCLVWILLEHLSQATETELNVLVQLPADAEFDDVEKRWHGVPNIEVWRDPDSRNAKALKKLFLKK